MPFLQDSIRADIRGATARLVEPLTYKGATDTFTIPTGFLTDFASVPQCMTWLVPKMGAWTEASVLHDYLCVRLGLTFEPPPATAIDTDGIFRRVMRENGVGVVRRWLMWTAVRWGALSSPARRTGWLSTAPAVLGISLLAAPVLIPATAAVVVTLLIDRAVEAVR